MILIGCNKSTSKIVRRVCEAVFMGFMRSSDAVRFRCNRNRIILTESLVLTIMKQVRQKNWITVGGKLTLGIALISNLCIGILLTANWQMAKHLETMTGELMSIKDDLNCDLRHKVLEIQEKYLKISDFFRVDPTREMFDWLAGAYPVKSDELLRGRDAYTPLFSRRERRDLSKGGFVINYDAGKIKVSAGILDDSAAFGEVVRQMIVEGTDHDYQAVAYTLEEIISRNSGADALKIRMSQLGAMLADEALEAEVDRIRILQFVDTIGAREKVLAERKLYFGRMGVILGIGTVAANIIALYIMAFLMIERPLKRLSSVITLIRRGEAPDVPFQKRRDEIGALAGTVKSFRDVLAELRNEGLRREQEQAVVSDTIQLMTHVIEQQRAGSQEMTLTAFQLNSLATDTQQQSSSVTETASRTAENTMAVSEAASSLMASAGQTLDQLDSQNRLVEEIARDTRGSRVTIDRLTRASEEISSIISLVKDIADRTRLLALNATIEAARAGEKGKGFAVVALEVKELSKQTEQATREVSGKIGFIREETGSVMGSIGNIDGKIEHLMDISRRVNAAVQAQQRFTESIASMTSSTTEETRDVSHRITQVEQAAVSTLELSGKVHEHSETISRSMAHLLNETTRRLHSIGRNQAA